MASICVSDAESKALVGSVRVRMKGLRVGLRVKGLGSRIHCLWFKVKGLTVGGL